MKFRSICQTASYRITYSFNLTLGDEAGRSCKTYGRVMKYMQNFSLEKLVGGGLCGELRHMLEDDDKVDVDEVKYDCVV
jgi:hypothetical protein